MKIDAHQHFWTYSADEYGWISDDMRAIRHDFLPPMLEAIHAAVGFDGSVAVQARQTLAETRWLLELARRHAGIRGVVGWVPLAATDLAAHLDALAGFAALKGVRHVVQAEPDPDFLAADAFNAGLRQITARGLVYDLLIVAKQLPAAIAFVDRHPRQMFVLDHIAKPVLARDPDPIWRQHIAELARRPNVACKFSGVVTETPGWSWDLDLVRRHFEVVLEAFGPQRLMFGSDWPVCLVAAEYAAWLQCVEACAAPLSPDEKVQLFGGTATRVYKLPS